MAYSKRKNSNNDMKVDIGIERDMIDLMIMFALSDSPLVNVRAVINLKKLIFSITFDDDVYEARLKFNILKEILKMEVDDHIFNFPILKSELEKIFVENKDYVNSVLEDALECPLIEDDILYINKFVEERLKYLYLYEYKTKLKACLEELENSTDMNAVTSHFETEINGLYKAIQNSKSLTKDAAEDFCIGNRMEKNFQPMVKRTIDSLNKPNNFIRTGISKLNGMLGGGLENGRCYIVYAPPKSWKSGLLMNFGIWACKYNEFQPKDPSKTPCVLLVSMENTPKESLKRLFSYVTGDDIKNYTSKEATEIINREIIGDRNISFEFRYRRTHSISTLDLNAMIDDLALEGKEVVLLIQDYMKRIKSSSYDPDLRLDLGTRTDDMCSIARERDIPVLSAMQINRAGMAKIDGAARTNKTSLVKMLGKIDAGESALPLENTDYAFCIYPEEDPNGEKYLGFNSWVSRVEIKETDSFFLHPFKNGMRLEEDIDGPSLSLTENPKESERKMDVASFNPAAAREKWLSKGGRVKTMSDELNEDDLEF